MNSKKVAIGYQIKGAQCTPGEGFPALDETPRGQNPELKKRKMMRSVRLFYKDEEFTNLPKISLLSESRCSNLNTHSVGCRFKRRENEVIENIGGNHRPVFVILQEDG